MSFPAYDFKPDYQETLRMAGWRAHLRVPPVFGVIPSSTEGRIHTIDIDKKNICLTEFEGELFVVDRLTIDTLDALEELGEEVVSDNGSLRINYKNYKLGPDEHPDEPALFKSVAQAQHIWKPSSADTQRITIWTLFAHEEWSDRRVGFAIGVSKGRVRAYRNAIDEIEDVLYEHPDWTAEQISAHTKRKLGLVSLIHPQLAKRSTGKNDQLKRVGRDGRWRAWKKKADSNPKAARCSFCNKPKTPMFSAEWRTIAPRHICAEDAGAAFRQLNKPQRYKNLTAVIRTPLEQTVAKTQREKKALFKRFLEEKRRLKCWSNYKVVLHGEYVELDGVTMCDALADFQEAFVALGKAIDNKTWKEARKQHEAVAAILQIDLDEPERE